MQKTLAVAREYLLLTLGTFLVAAGVYFFKFPNSFNTGGVTGLAVILNAVFPAGTESEMFHRDMASCEGGYEVNVARLAASYPLGRIAVPMDIAPAALFLASPAASFMTGAHIVLDAGFTIQ